MNRHVRNSLALWLLLLMLGATAFGCSFISMPRDARLLLLLPSLVIVAVIAIGFMEIRRGGALSRAFAVAALFWLFILLALGTMDPMTRQVYPAPITLPGK